jgi:thiamine biosynthesis lipoprotein
MSRKIRKILLAAFFGAILIVAVCLLIARNKPASPVEIDSGYRLVMGTFARVVAVASDAETAKKSIDAAFEQFRQIEALMSWRKEDSEIARVNRDAYVNPVTVSSPTFEVLQKSVEFSRLSEGAFDITVGPLMELWRSAQDVNRVPTDAELQQVRSKVGFEKLILDANEKTIRFAVDGMKLDLGGIAKGYAVDKAVEAMQASGAIGAMVDAGGNIRCFGTPPKGKTHWLIGLQDPNVTDEQMKVDRTILTLKFTDNAVATSGDYRRFVVVGGRRHSHIIDPATGQSSESLASVTIICPNATDADALATAVTVMGKEKGLAFIERMPDVEAILITPAPEFKQIQTPGVEKFIK